MTLKLRRCAAIILASAASLSACTVTLVSSYDEQTDKSATALQQKGDTFYQTLINATPPDCLYARTKRFYNQIQIDLGVMKTRADAIDMNSFTSSQITNIQQIFKLEEQIQQSHVKDAAAEDKPETCIDKDAAAADQAAFDQAIEAVLKLELAKKRGDSISSGGK